jgi:alkylation response protein AidB-like acyl-CoA dehydrogenase
MDFQLAEELRILKQTVRRFVDEEMIPLEGKSLDGGKIKPGIKAALDEKAKALGLWLIDVPEEFGGQGLGLLARSVVWEELGRTVALPTRGVSIIGPEVRPILYALSDEMKERYLYPVIRGEKHCCFAQTEPDAGSDPGSMRTTAVRDGDDYVINGVKRFITGADHADFAQVMAATDREKGSRGGISCFLVDMDTPGIRLGAPRGRSSSRTCAFPPATWWAKRAAVSAWPSNGSASGASSRPRGPSVSPNAALSWAPAMPRNALPSAGPWPTVRPSNGCWPTRGWGFTARD